MALKHRKGDHSPGWIQAVVFNTVMLLTPFLAANAISGLFAAQNFAPEPRIEAIVATRERVDMAFADIVPRSVNRRAFWADRIDQALRDNNIPAARGFLLAAPHMLDSLDQTAISAAARDFPFGTADQKLLQAAVLFLPSDVRARYERKLQPLSAVPDPARRPRNPLAVLGDETEQPTGEVSLDGLRVTSADTLAPLSRRPSERTPQFSLLGTFDDLSRHSRRWLRDADDPGIELRLTGVSLLAPPFETVSPEGAGKAASVLRSALRANRLTPAFVNRLERALDAAMPAAQLRVRLGTALEDTLSSNQRAGQVEAAFRDTLTPSGLNPLSWTLQQVAAIADATSSVSAVALIEHIEDGKDLRRMRTVVEAGGDRATALETQIGEDILDMARTGVSVSRYTVLQVVGLAAALLLLFWQAAMAVQRQLQNRFSSSSYA